MPYKRVDKEVMVRKGHAWRRLKLHDSVKAAEAHLTALRINVRPHYKKK